MTHSDVLTKADLKASLSELACALRLWMICINMVVAGLFAVALKLCQ
jgi:hypothetical protein